MKRVRRTGSEVRSPESEVRQRGSEAQSQLPKIEIRNSKLARGLFEFRFSNFDFRHRTSDLGRRTLLFLLIIASLAILYPLQKRIDNLSSSIRSQREELMILPSESKLPRLSGGYSGLLADIYWTRAVQYYGRHRLAHAKEFALLGTLLDITTELDPHLLIAYRFGSLFLAGLPPEGAGDPERAIHLLERGIAANPDYWRFWEDLGFIYYWDMKDYGRAARAFQTGSERPGALPWMRVLAASVASQGGELQTSRLLWTEIARNAGTDSIRHSAENHLAALDALEALRKIDGWLALYRQQQGREPSSLQDLVAAGYLRKVPLDPSGEPFAIAPNGHATLGPGTRIDLGLVE